MGRYYIIPDLRHIEQIFNKLKAALPCAYQNIQLAFCCTEYDDYKTYQGGYATPSTIIIGTEFINKYTDDISIAEVLAHELGHHVLGHLTGDLDREVVPEEEFDADHFGMFLCELVGFSRLKYIKWFEKFEIEREDTLSETHIKEHSTGKDRVNRLKLQDKYLNNI